MDSSTALRFLLASRQRELLELQELSATVELVEAVAVAIHALQRERGLSSLYWGRADPIAHQALRDQRNQTDEARAQLHAALERLDPGREAASPRQGSRLYAALAQALQADEACEALRDRISLYPPAGSAVRGPQCSLAQVTAAYVHMVSRWIAVIQEAADIAVDADVSRHLVSLFQLIQAKEWMGQERAYGSRLFTQGQAWPDDLSALLELKESQSRCLAGFLQFAPPGLQAEGATWEALPGWVRREGLRRRIEAAEVHGALSPGSGDVWFAACTSCMEALRSMEVRLLEALRDECTTKATRLAQELRAFCAWVAQDPLGRRPTSDEALADLIGGPSRHGLDTSLSAPGPQALALVHEQALRVQRLSTDLDAARAALHERKVIERAKGLWMQHTGQSEEVAYRTLRRVAMDRGIRLLDLSEELLQCTKDVQAASSRTAPGQ
jgi:hypothetical protein